MINLKNINKKTTNPSDRKVVKCKKFIAISAIVMALTGQQAFASKGDYSDESANRYSRYNDSLSMELKNKMGNNWNSESNNDAINYQPVNSKGGYWMYVPGQMTKAEKKREINTSWINNASAYPIYLD